MATALDRLETLINPLLDMQKIVHDAELLSMQMRHTEMEMNSLRIHLDDMARFEGATPQQRANAVSIPRQSRGMLTQYLHPTNGALSVQQRAIQERLQLIVPQVQAIAHQAQNNQVTTPLPEMLKIRRDLMELANGYHQLKQQTDYAEALAENVASYLEARHDQIPNGGEIILDELEHQLRNDLQPRVRHIHEHPTEITSTRLNNPDAVVARTQNLTDSGLRSKRRKLYRNLELENTRYGKLLDQARNLAPSTQQGQNQQAGIAGPSAGGHHSHGR